MFNALKKIIGGLYYAFALLAIYAVMVWTSMHKNIKPVMNVGTFIDSCIGTSLKDIFLGE